MRPIGLLLLVVALLHGCLYAFLLPPWQAPDEVAHFVYARLIVERGRLPVNEAASPELEAALLDSLARYRAWDYRGEPQPNPLPDQLATTSFFYYFILARWSLGHLPYAAVLWPLLAVPLEVQLYAVRLLSVVLGACVVLLTYKLARLVQPRRPGLAVTAAVFVLLLPQHAFINASINDGNTTALAVTAALYLLALMVRRGLTWPRLVGLVAATAYALLSKATAYFLLPLLLVVGPWLIWRQWTRTRPPGTAGRPWMVAGVAALALLVVALPVALAAPRLGYVRQMLRAGEAYWSSAGERWADLVATGRLFQALADTFRTFWGNFGWVVVWLPAGWYTLLFVLTALAGVGLVVWAWRGRRAPGSGRPLYLLLVAAPLGALGVLVVWFIASPDGLTYYQGRYLFSVVAPIAVLLATGWTQLFPARLRPLAPVSVLVVMAVVSSAAWFGVAVPYFYAW